MIRFVLVGAGVLFALAALMELVDLGLREAGMSEGTADLVSLLAVVLIASKVVPRFPPDEASLAWASTAPTTAAAVVGVLIAAFLSGWFFVSEGDTGEAAGASALACLVALLCAWMARRDYAKRPDG